MNLFLIITYSLLFLGVLSTQLKIKVGNKIPLWLILSFASLIMAANLDLVNFISLIYTAIFCSSMYLYFQKKNTLLFLLVLILSIPLLLHIPLLGFNNYKYLDQINLSSGSIPYSLYFNLDKTLVGIFILGFAYKNQQTNYPNIIKWVGLLLLIMAPLFFILTTRLGYTDFDPKLPYFTPVWILTNLFFTCMAEEAFFRKLIQQKIQDSISGKYSPIISITVASILFGLAHFKGGIPYVLLATLAGGFFGYIYYKTKRIESSILLHFAFNLTHFLLFTYPALR